MRVTTANIPSVLVIDPQIFGDERGFFVETWSAERYAKIGAPPFVQDNLSRSAQGVLRGLHLQHPRGQGKLVQVIEGEVFDVAVDVRVGSPTFGRWVGYHLSGENKRQLYIPCDFAHGFCVISTYAIFSYKCTEIYVPEAELGVRWNDPTLKIPWPTSKPLLSAKDASLSFLRDISESRLPTFVNARS